MVLTGTSEETAICWWLASTQNMIWPEINEMTDEEFNSYDSDGDGDQGKTVLNYLIKMKNAKILGWFDLDESTKDEFRSHARRDRKRRYKIIGDKKCHYKIRTVKNGWRRKKIFINSRKKKSHYRMVWVKK